MSTFDAIGGAPVVSTAVTILYDRVTADPVLSPWFDGIDLRKLRVHQRDFLTVALGGPEEFYGRSLREAHGDLAVTDEAFSAIIEHLRQILSDLGIAVEGIQRIVDRVEVLRTQIVHQPDAENPVTP